MLEGHFGIVSGQPICTSFVSKIKTGTFMAFCLRRQTVVCLFVILSKSLMFLVSGYLAVVVTRCVSYKVICLLTCWPFNALGCSGI